MSRSPPIEIARWPMADKWGGKCIRENTAFSTILRGCVRVQVCQAAVWIAFAFGLLSVMTTQVSWQVAASFYKPPAMRAGNHLDYTKWLGCSWWELWIFKTWAYLAVILSAIHEGTMLTSASWDWCFEFIQMPLPLHTSYPWYNAGWVISWKIEFHWSVRSSQLHISHHLCVLARRLDYWFHALQTTISELIWSDLMVGSTDLIWPVRYIGYECMTGTLQAFIVGRAITTYTWMYF